MKLPGIAAAVLILLSSPAIPCAGEIYTWKGEDGTLMMTDRPPPEYVQVHDVSRYREKTALEITEESREAEIERQDLQKEQVLEDVRAAKSDTAAAMKEAEEAVARAQEANKVLEYNIDKYGSSKNKRKKFRSKIQRLTDAANAEKARADAAVDRANRAAAAAREAEENARAPEPQSR